MDKLHFTDWEKVPYRLRTQKTWKTNRFRDVLEDAEAAADITFQVSETTFATVPLYSESQTEAFEPTPKQKAFEDFWQVFCGPMRKDKHISRTVDGWRYREIEAFKFYNRLNRENVRSHLKQNQPRGVLPVDDRYAATRFVTIDLDLHEKDREIFLRMTNVLLEHFWNRCNCVIGLNPEHINGLHLIIILKDRQNVTHITNKIKKQLEFLDKHNPGLVADAATVCMNPFSSLEVFPRQDRGVRLPIGKNYGFIADKLYKADNPDNCLFLMNWVNNPKRKRMSLPDIMQCISSKLRPFVQKAPARLKKPKPLPPIPSLKPREPKSICSKVSVQVPRSQKTSLKGNFFNVLKKFWVLGEPLSECDGNYLNKQVLYISRLARAYGFEQETIVTSLMLMLDGLPHGSKAYSRRLQSDNKTLSTEVARFVENSFKKELGPHILDTARVWRKRYPTFHPLDPSTWQTAQKKLTLKWNAADASHFYTVLSPILNIKHRNTILKFIRDLLTIVIKKENQNTGFGRGYVRKAFPDIRFGHKQKTSTLFRALQSLQIIQLAPYGKGRKGKGCSKWRLGTKALAAMT